MSERRQQMYVTSVSTSTVILSPTPTDPPNKAGLGIQQVTVSTTESTAEAGFWGTTGSCSVFECYFRKVQ